MSLFLAHAHGSSKPCTCWSAILGSHSLFWHARRFCTTLIDDIATFNYLDAPRSSLAAECLSIPIANIQWQKSTRHITAIVGPIFALAAFTNVATAPVTLSPADTEEVQSASKASTKHTIHHQSSTDYGVTPVVLCLEDSHPLQIPRSASFAQLYLPAPYPHVTLQTFHTGPRIA